MLDRILETKRKRSRSHHEATFDFPRDTKKQSLRIVKDLKSARGIIRETNKLWTKLFRFTIASV